MAVLFWKVLESFESLSNVFPGSLSNFYTVYQFYTSWAHTQVVNPQCLLFLAPVWFYQSPHSWWPWSRPAIQLKVMLSLLEYTNFMGTFCPDLFLELWIRCLDKQISLIFLCSSSDFQSAGLWLYFCKLQHDMPQRRPVWSSGWDNRLLLLPRIYRKWHNVLLR